MSKIAIVGLGHVGVGMQTIFPDAILIDPPKGYHGMGHGDSDVHARRCDLAIVCVPTPMRADGSCDISIVDKVVSELESEYILIKSTVPPGTCRELALKHAKRLVFSPEYMGESTYWTPSWAPNPRDPLSHGFCILGGHPYWTGSVADILLPRLGPATRFRLMSYEEAELVKYFENAFFSLKVTFANQMRVVCEAMPSDRVNYFNVREGWIDDPRVGPLHSAAFKQQRGYGGKCLPKDTAALKHFCDSIGALSMSELLGAVMEANEMVRRSLKDDDCDTVKEAM
jgi:UDPglucose 6-dehydrogenase